MLGQIDLDFRNQIPPKEQSISKLNLFFWTNLQPQNAIPVKNHTKGCYRITRTQAKLAQNFFTEAYSFKTLRFEFRINLGKIDTFGNERVKLRVVAARKKKRKEKRKLAKQWTRDNNAKFRCDDHKK